MKNNKGLTVVELVVSFALASVVAIFLIQIVLLLKDLYISNGARSVLMGKQSVVTDRMNALFEDRKVTWAEKCGDTCVRLRFDDNVEQLISIDPSAKVISIGDYSNKFPESTVFGDIVIKTQELTTSTNHYNSIFQIYIPITDKIVTMQRFDINVLYQYDKRVENWSL